MKQFIFKNYVIILIVFIGSFIRFFNPLWDNGLYLHPDERLFVNASSLALPRTISDFFSPSSPLNPHMFYYGSLLLYVYKLASLISPFSFLMTSRLISAFLSSLSIAIVFLIGKELFSKKVGLLSSIVFAFAVGSIQYAHFNTTESSLILLVSLITYFDILAVRKKMPQLLTASLFLVGIAGAIKITGLTFGISSLVAAIALIKEHVSLKRVLRYFLVSCLLAGIIYVIFSPYQFIDWKEAAAQQSYMQAVTYGVFKPPFVIIYEHTPIYLYQVLRIFPFVFGFLSFPCALVGFFLIVLKIKNNWRKEYLYVFLFAFPLIYFAWAGYWFAKYERYYLLLLPFLSIWAGYFLSKLKHSLLLIFMLVICLNGLLFFRIYFSENTRVRASEWIYANLPQHSSIATEHWDDALPIALPKTNKSYTMLTLTVYDPESPRKIETLAKTLAKSDYIVLSSRRVYASILQNQETYPETSNMYTKLFTNQLGFRIFYKATNYPFFFSDDFADETFQSYDHPPVIIFFNQEHLSVHEILSRLRLP